MKVWGQRPIPIGDKTNRGGGNLLVSHVDVDVIDDDDVNVNVDIDDDHLFCHLVNLVRSQPDRICGYCPEELGVTDLE